MAIGTSRVNAYGKELQGWGAVFTTVKTSAISTATTLTVTGSGGSSEGVQPISVGMTVYFPDDLTETAHAITAIVANGSDTDLTISALVNAQSAGNNVMIDYAPNISLLMDSFSDNLNNNKWSPMPYSGTRAKNIARRGGRTEVDGSADFMLRPSVNLALLARSIGYDYVTGTGSTSPNTTNGATVVGASQVTLTSATGYTVNAFIQIGTGTISEVRKITVVATNLLTLDAPLHYAHANGVATKVVTAPFTHIVPSATVNLPTINLYDFVPYDDESNVPNYVSKYAYYLPGSMLKSAKIESQTENGIKVTLDYMSQDKVKLPVTAGLTTPSETVYAFDQEAVLIAGTQNKRIEDISIDLQNDPQKKYAKNNSRRCFTIKAGQQEVKGSMKAYWNETTQAQFWAALKDDTQLALQYKITDTTTTYYVQFDIWKIVIDKVEDGSFAPGDLIDGSLDWTSVLDAGGNNEQIRLTILNGDWLTY